MLLENIWLSPSQIQFVVTSWQNKVSWMSKNILEAIEASGLAASNIWIVIQKFELVPVEEAYETQFGVDPGLETTFLL